MGAKDALLPLAAEWGTCFHASDVRGEEVAAVAVEVAAGAVAVLGGARISMTGQYLCVAERDAGVESVRDGGVS